MRFLNNLYKVIDDLPACECDDAPDIADVMEWAAQGAIPINAHFCKSVKEKYRRYRQMHLDLMEAAERTYGGNDERR